MPTENQEVKARGELHARATRYWDEIKRTHADSWDKYEAIGEAMVDARQQIMHKLGNRKDPTGPAYRKEMKSWLIDHKLDDMHKTTRSHLCTLIDNIDEVRKMMSKWTLAERALWVAPNSVHTKWKSWRVEQGIVEKKPKKANTSETEVIVELKKEKAILERKLGEAEKHKDNLRDVANTLGEDVEKLEKDLKSAREAQPKTKELAAAKARIDELEMDLEDDDKRLSAEVRDNLNAAEERINELEMLEIQLEEKAEAAQKRINELEAERGDLKTMDAGQIVDFILKQPASKKSAIKHDLDRELGSRKKSEIDDLKHDLEELQKLYHTEVTRLKLDDVDIVKHLREEMYGKSVEENQQIIGRLQLALNEAIGFKSRQQKHEEKASNKEKSKSIKANRAAKAAEMKARRAAKAAEIKARHDEVTKHVAEGVLDATTGTQHAMSMMKQGSEAKPPLPDDLTIPPSMRR